MKEPARRLRRNMMDAESRMWYYLYKRLGGAEFTRVRATPTTLIPNPSPSRATL